MALEKGASGRGGGQAWSKAAGSLDLVGHRHLT